MTSSFIPLTQLLTINEFPFAKFKTNASIMESSEFVFSKQTVMNLAAMLSEKPCERVFIACHDRAFFVCALFASLAVQKTICLPHMLTRTSVAEVMCNEGDILITDQENLTDVRQNTLLKTMITPQRTYVTPQTLSANQIITFYTSGSSGAPKPIHKSLFQLEAELQCLHALWGGYQGTFHSTVSHQHIYGFLFSVLWPLCAGYTIARYTYALWEDMFLQLSENDVIISSPSHLGRFPLNEKPVMYPRLVFSSGAPLALRFAYLTHEYLKVFPIEVYGSTETGGIAHRIQKNENENAWNPFSVVNVSANKDNQLCIKSPYLPNTNLFITEDYVSFNKDSTFILNGRADRVVKIEGKRICLSDIEHRVKSHNFILDAASLLLASNSRSELGVIAVLNSAGEQNLANYGKAAFVKEIRSYLSAFLEPIFIPKRWRFVQKIPQNEQGKRITSLLSDYFKKDSA